MLQAIAYYSFATLAWLSAQAVPLILSPTFIASLLTPNYQHANREYTYLGTRHRDPKALGDGYPCQYMANTELAVEEYFARSLGFTQLALGLIVVTLSGAVPLTSLTECKFMRPPYLHVEHETASSEPFAAPTDAGSPYANAVVLLSTLYHFSTAFFSYTRYTESGIGGFALGIIGSGTLAAFGLWVLMFGSGGHISKRTGADKRTSGFPFSNHVANKRKGKEL